MYWNARDHKNDGKGTFDFAAFATNQAKMMEFMNPLNWMDAGSINSMQRALIESQLEMLKDYTRFLESTLTQLDPSGDSCHTE